MQIFEDNELINRISRGDTIAFGKFYDIHFRKVFQFARCFVKPIFLCQEIVSDVFISVWQTRTNLPKINHISSYLFTITRNKALDYLDKQSRKPEFTSDIPLGISISNSDPENIYMYSEMEEFINKAVDELPERCKLIFLMSREGKLRYKDIARILSISEKTVQAQIITAMKKIAEALKKFIVVLLMVQIGDVISIF